MKIRASILLDNNMVESSTTTYGMVEVGENDVSDLLERFNDRLNDLERDVRLLQQPSGSVSWAKR